MWNRLLAITVILTTFAVCARPTVSRASCGCEKPPPVASAIRPNFAFPTQDPYAACDLKKGGCVALFGSGLVAGRAYHVQFRPTSGRRDDRRDDCDDRRDDCDDRDDRRDDDDVKRVKVVAQQRRDLADGAWRVQLWVPVPPRMSLGPATVEVRDSAGSTVLTIPDTDFTVIAPPIVVPAGGGVLVLDRYRAAVGRDGTVYVALDVTGMLPRVDFASQGFNLPLHYAKDDMVIYNTQGVVMERLSSTVQDEDLNNDGDSNDPGEGDFNRNGLLDNPDISAVVPNFDLDSNAFFYSRHPFDTYDVDHQPGAPHALDPSDTNWHVDGTRHTDNFHFVAAIARATLKGQPLAPGRSNPFALALDAAVTPPANPTTTTAPATPTTAVPAAPTTTPPALP